MFLYKNTVTFLLFYLSTFVVFKLMQDPTQAILIWPAAGVGIIAALVWGYRVLPGLYLSQLAISILLNPDVYTDFSLHEFYITNMFILAGLFRCYFGAYLIKYFVGYPNSLITFKSIFKFFFLAAPLATLASTLAYDLVKYHLGFVNSIAFTRTTLDWWFGDLIGFIIFAPITLIFIAQPKSIWKPRYLTVGLPITILLLSIIFIYNKSQISDNKRVIDNLQIKNQLIASKIEKHNIWMGEFLDDIFYHFLSEGNSYEKISNYFNSLNNTGNKASAILWRFNDKEKQSIKISKTFSDNHFKKFVNFKFDNYHTQNNNLNKNHKSTLYIKEFDQFVNIFNFTKGNNYKLSIIVAHNIESEIKVFKNELLLNNTKTSIILTDGQIVSFDNKPLSKFPNKKIVVENNLNFNDEVWKLINEPTARYIFHNESNLSSIIAKVGLVFTGLIGLILLILTGKTSLTKIHVQERTLDLDVEAKDLKKSKQQYEELIEQHPVILWRLNLESKKVTYISEKAIDLFGHSLESWLSEKDFWFNHIHEDDQEKTNLIIKKALRNNSGFELKYRFIKNDHSIAWVKDVINISLDKNANLQFVGLMVDESETRNAKEEQVISESKYRTLFKHATDPLIIIDLDDHTFRDANDKAVSLFGLDNISGNVTLTNFSPIKQPDGGRSEKGLKRKFRKLDNHERIDFEWSMFNRDHKEIICNIDLVKLPQLNKKIALANINDITQNKLHQKKINQLAYYDNLTKLPNREYFYSKFEYFHSLAVEQKKFGAIIYLDLDRFKILNDSLGHQAGDELLKMVANRIRSVSSKNSFCARLGGDEFIILNKKFEKTIESTLENILVKAELILEELNEPYQLDDYEHFITPSIGISYFPFSNNSIDQIIHQADIAMYASKEKGKNTITIYQDKMVKHVGRSLKIEKAIRQALANNEFQLYYQPQTDNNNNIFSVEALLRWHRLKELKINTEELIDIIEQIGLTHELGYWVFDQACAQLEEWQIQDIKLTSMAINVSAKQFHQPLFVQQVQSVIQSYNIQPSQIVLELTEAVIIEDMSSLILTLSELRDYGIRTSLDDFGTGYSSLAYLKHLPIDQLKIDKLFIHDLATDLTSQNIVKTIVNLANSMGLELIAEGIEMKEQFDILKELGCKNFQGFYFSTPLPAEELFK